MDHASCIDSSSIVWLCCEVEGRHWGEVIPPHEPPAVESYPVGNLLNLRASHSIHEAETDMRTDNTVMLQQCRLGARIALLATASWKSITFAR